MPRNAAGTYSLPAGNPVVTGTPISSVWANDTMADVAAELTDSLSRTGEGAMLAALALDSGSVGAPGLAFSAELTSGLYRNAAGDHRYSIAGVDLLHLETNLFSVKGTAPAFRINEIDAAANNRLWDAIVTGEAFKMRVLSDAFVAVDWLAIQRTANTVDSITLTAATITFAGAISLSGALDVTGDFSVATNKFNVAAASGNTLVAGTLGVTGVAGGPVGSAAAPTWSFSGDPDTGLYRSAGNELALSAGNSARLTLGTDATWASNVHHLAGGGTAAAPIYSFSGDPDTGIFNSVGLLRFSADGVEVFRVNSTVVNPLMVVRGVDGDATAPAYSFTSDTNTGFYQAIADDIGMSLGGTAYLVGFRNIPQVIKDISYTLVLADAAKHIYKSAGGAGETITIPSNASVPYPIGTTVTFINHGGGTLSIAITTDAMQMSPGGATGTRTLADKGMATAIKVTATLWVISGNGLT